MPNPLAAATTDLAAVNAYDAVSADPKAAGGVNLSITVGSSKSDSTSTTTYDTAAGSTVAAGGNVRISATGAGQDSDLTVRGSDISADGNAHLKADGDINLLAADNTVETHRNSSNASAGVGLAISVGQGGTAMGITANASLGKGKSKGRDVTWTHTHVNAGNRLTLESGGDTTLRGAVASGKQVAADVGVNLNIESLQDTHSFKSKDTNIGGSATVGAGFSASANVGKQTINSDYASVTEQAVQDALNTLTTGTLTVSDIKNHAEYEASSVSIGDGYSVGKGGMKEVGRHGDGQGAGGGVGTNQQGQASKNFKTFDHFTPDGVAISTKTLDTSAKTYQSASKITYRINHYVDSMEGFVEAGKGKKLDLINDIVSAKQLQLGIPASTNAKQMAAIAKSIDYAASKGIGIIVTKVKG